VALLIPLLAWAAAALLGAWQDYRERSRKERRKQLIERTIFRDAAASSRARMRGDDQS